MKLLTFIALFASALAEPSLVETNQQVAEQADPKSSVQKDTMAEDVDVARKFFTSQVAAAQAASPDAHSSAWFQNMIGQLKARHSEEVEILEKKHKKAVDENKDQKTIIGILNKEKEDDWRKEAQRAARVDAKTKVLKAHEETVDAKLKTVLKSVDPKNDPNATQASDINELVREKDRVVQKINSLDSPKPSSKIDEELGLKPLNTQADKFKKEIESLDKKINAILVKGKPEGKAAAKLARLERLRLKLQKKVQFTEDKLEDDDDTQDKKDGKKEETEIPAIDLVEEKELRTKLEERVAALRRTAQVATAQLHDYANLFDADEKSGPDQDLLAAQQEAKTAKMHTKVLLRELNRLRRSNFEISHGKPAPEPPISIPPIPEVPAPAPAPAQEAAAVAAAKEQAYQDEMKQLKKEEAAAEAKEAEKAKTDAVKRATKEAAAEVAKEVAPPPVEAPKPKAAAPKPETAAPKPEATPDAAAPKPEATAPDAAAPKPEATAPDAAAPKPEATAPDAAPKPEATPDAAPKPEAAAAPDAAAPKPEAAAAPDAAAPKPEAAAAPKPETAASF